MPVIQTSCVPSISTDPTSPSPALRRVRSMPAAIADIFEPPAPAKTPLHAEFLARAEGLLGSVQRELTEDDYALARIQPCSEANKKLGDYGSLGMSACWRRMERARLAGNQGEQALNAAGFFACEMAGIASAGLLNVLALGGRYARQKIAGAPILNPRSAAGTREDLLLRVLPAWRQTLTRKVAQQLREEAPSDNARLELLTAHMQAEEQVRKFVRTHPEARLRYSVPLDKELGALRRDVDAFCRVLTIP